MSLEILQKSQKNTCAKVSFLIELQAFIKKRLWHRCFPVNFAQFLRTPFLLLNNSGGCFYLELKWISNWELWQEGLIQTKMKVGIRFWGPNLKLGFTPSKAEQPLRGMELQGKKHKKDYRVQKICLERTYS